MKKKQTVEKKTLFHKILEVLSSIFAVVVILVCAGTLIFRMIFKIEVINIIIFITAQGCL